ncbi:MAG: transposase [Nitrososphaerota archaeon]|nr:transposase [Nitrososphaerota archaeon]
MGGWCYVEVLKRCAKFDWVHQVVWLLVGFYLEVDEVCLVLDNLNSRTVGFLYLVFSAEKVCSLVRCLEFHYMSKYGSWFNVAEFELSALTCLCLGRRVPDVEAFNR